MSYGGSFGGINTALRGLLAQQAALDTTGHNMSNINTDGYTRQRVDLATTTPYYMPTSGTTGPGQIGQGVQITGISRLRDTYIDNNFRSQTSNAGTWGNKSLSMQQIEAAINEPSDTGIAAALRKFWGALDAVAAAPNDIAARTAMIGQAQTLATRFHQVDQQLTDISDQSDQRIDADITTVNSITTQIATLNTQIKQSIASGLSPNDLKDQRDLLLDQLASKINFTATTSSPYDEVTVTFGTTVPIVIVDPTTAPGSTALTRADLDTAYGNGDLTAGEIYADEDQFTTVIPNLQTQLDDFVDSFITAFNTQHALGDDMTATAGGNFFDPAGVTAATIAVDATLAADPRMIAVRASGAGAGNTDNAFALIALKSAPQGALTLPWDDAFEQIVAGVGTIVQQTNDNNSHAEMLVDVLSQQRASTSGVSLDEEMSNMLRFQHAYDASARVMTAFDDLLETLINRTGRVGL